LRENKDVRIQKFFETFSQRFLSNPVNQFYEIFFSSRSVSLLRPIADDGSDIKGLSAK